LNEQKYHLCLFHFTDDIPLYLQPLFTLLNCCKDAISFSKSVRRASILRSSVLEFLNKRSRNWIVVPARQATEAGGIDSLESIIVLGIDSWAS
jgi:hypothetical protein